MPETTGTAAFAIMCAASFVLLLQLPTKPFETMSEHDERWFSENSKYSTSGSYVMIVDGTTIGIIAGLLVARISKDVLPPTTMGIVFMVVAFTFFLLDRKAPTILALGRSQLAFLPILVCGLVLSGFLAAPWNTIASLPLFAVLYLFDYTNSSVLSLRGSLLSISPCYCFAKGRFFITLGQAIGWFGGAFLASGIGRGALPAVSVTMVFLVCAYVTAAAIKPEKYPIITDEAKLPQAQAGEVPPPEALQPEPIVERPYKRKCAQATMAYDLTPRESEILFYLAKGRNAKYIADQLYVAERTVKTHTYHIYQKMGIHSQQELIDIVEKEGNG